MKRLVLDTNILLLDSENLLTLGKDGTIIVLPEVVLEEADNKKSGLGEIHYQARQLGRTLAACDVDTEVKREHGMVITTLRSGDVVIEVVSLDSYSGVSLTDSGANDQKIIAVAQRVHDVYGGTVFMSNDVMARLRALGVGLEVTDLKEVSSTEHEFTKKFVVEDNEVFRTLHSKNIVDVDKDYKYENFNYKFSCPTTGQIKLATVTGGVISILGKDTEKELHRQDVTPINAEQLLLSRAIQEPSIDVVVCESLAGSGKAQPLSEPILTDKGWSTMGEMAVGSTVIGSDGASKRVTSIHPQGIRDTYEVTFIDGTKVRCDRDHIWSVRSRSKGNYTSFKPTTVSTMLESWVAKEKYDKRYGSYQNMYNYSIQPSEACVFGKDAGQSIAPYALGLLLGDGSFGTTSVSFSNGSEEIVTKLKEALEPEYTIATITYTQGAYRGYVSKGTAEVPFKEVLRSYGLDEVKSPSKFVPYTYLNGTLETREAVFQGLTDTDGYVKKGMVLEYSTSSKRLADDYLELGRSLGRVFTVNDRIPEYKYNGEVLEGLRNYRIREMKRKPKSIVSIHKVGEELAQCITIDSKDSLYITTGYNLTHNTLVALSNAIKLVKQKKYGSILYVRASVNDVDQAEEVGFLPGLEEKFAVYLHPLRDSLEHIVRGRYKDSKHKGKEFEEKIEAEIEKLIEDCNIVATTTLGERGRTYDDTIIIRDEVQNQSKGSLVKGLTRIGKNCKLILLGSNRQIDNNYITKFNNGLSVILDACTKEQDVVKIYAVTLHKVVRGVIAEWSERLFSK